MIRFSEFLAESHTEILGRDTYRGKVIEITGDAFRYTEGSQYWERSSMRAIKDLIDSRLDAKAPPKRWRY